MSPIADTLMAMVRRYKMDGLQEREIIKEFEAEAGELDDFTGICKILLKKVRALG